MITIPFFVFMGNMLQKSGIAHDLFKAVQAWVGSSGGGIAAATILLCTVLAAMIGTVGLPQSLYRLLPRWDLTHCGSASYLILICRLPISLRPLGTPSFISKPWHRPM